MAPLCIRKEQGAEIMDRWMDGSSCTLKQHRLTDCTLINQFKTCTLISSTQVKIQFKALKTVSTKAERDFFEKTIAEVLKLFSQPI